MSEQMTEILEAITRLESVMGTLDMSFIILAIAVVALAVTMLFSELRR